ncbi:GatB/YqeY domain-containing protein [soil metagenome]
MAELKDRLRQDMSAAMKARDELTLATLRMALSAITTEEVSGQAARELSDDEVQGVLRRESKKRREAAEAFGAAGRAESATRERAEGEVLARYLPAQLDNAELTELVRRGIAEAGAISPADMGKVMRSVQPLVAGRTDGARGAAEVRRQLGG